MEHFELMDTILTEYAELLDWEAFEADLAESNPWEEPENDEPEEDPAENIPKNRWAE